MTGRGRTLELGLDGHWPALDFARLLHLLVRFHRFEEFLRVAREERPDLLSRPFDAITLKYLAAFDWIAPSLMSRAYSDSHARSEAFVAELGLADPVIAELAFAPGHERDSAIAGRIAIAGTPATIAVMRPLVMAALAPEDVTADPRRAAQGRFNAIEALYGANLRAKAALLGDAGYGEAELHAIVAPSLEDLQFLSNAAAQGRLVPLETGGEAG